MPSAELKNPAVGSAEMSMEMMASAEKLLVIIMTSSHPLSDLPTDANSIQKGSTMKNIDLGPMHASQTTRQRQS